MTQTPVQASVVGVAGVGQLATAVRVRLGRRVDRRGLAEDPLGLREGPRVAGGQPPGKDRQGLAPQRVGLGCHGLIHHRQAPRQLTAYCSFV
jgi:hypothetical protein